MDRKEISQRAEDALRHARSDVEDVRECARLVLDAILPQVTTVEELEALPEGAKVIGADGSAWEFGPYRFEWPWSGTNGDEWSTPDLLTNYGPLTVVWRP